MCTSNYTEIFSDHCQNGSIQEKLNMKTWPRCGAKGNHVQCWWVSKQVQLLWKSVWNFINMLKLELPSDPAIPLVAIDVKECK
jgi:hypothetical protein